MSTVEVKTAELIGPALDWAVAKAELVDVCIPESDVIWAKYCGPYNPSIHWSDGGPLISKYRFEFEWVGSDWHGEPLQFFTACGCDMPADATSAGPTHLIAACRAIVRAKLGDTVQIPAELA